MKIIGFFSSFLLFIAAVFFSIGIIIPNINFESRIEIERPVVLVFDAFTNSKILDDWLTGFQKIEKIEGNPRTAGSKYKLILKTNDELFTVIENVVDVREFEQLIIRGEQETMWTLSTTKFRSYGPITQVICIRSVKGKNLFWRSLLPFYKSEMVQQLANDLTNLKIVLEGRN